MLTIVETGAFRKDMQRVLKLKLDHGKLRRVVSQLAAEQPLEKRFRDHALSGDYADTRECHIQPDWLLIYAIDGDELLLIRTGTHSDLF